MAKYTTKYNYLSSIKYAILSFIGFLLILCAQYISTGALEFDWAFGLAIIIFLIFDRIAIEQDRQSKDLELIEKINDFEDRLSGEKITNWGNITRGNQRVVKKIAQADWVKNVFVGTNDHDEEEHVQTIVKGYELWLENKSKENWTDIVGIQEFFSPRYERFTAKYREGKHRLHVLRHSVPVMNFVIIGYGKSKEVFIGWLPEYKDGHEYYIFSSRSSAAVKLFEDYFDYLIDHKCWNDRKTPFELDTEKEGKDRFAHLPIVDKKGLWITFGLIADGVTDVHISSLGFVLLNFSDGKAEVSSVVYDSETGKITEDLRKPHEEISHYKNDVYVGYQLKNQTSGICHYRFQKTRDGKDVIVGTFIDREKGNRRTLIGMRSNFNDINEVAHLEKSKVDQIIAESKREMEGIELFEYSLGPRYESDENKI